MEFFFCRERTQCAETEIHNEKGGTEQPILRGWEGPETAPCPCGGAEGAPVDLDWWPDRGNRSLPEPHDVFVLIYEPHYVSFLVYDIRTGQSITWTSWCVYSDIWHTLQKTNRAAARAVRVRVLDFTDFVV